MTATHSLSSTLVMSHDTWCLQIVDGAECKKIGWTVPVTRGTSIEVLSRWNSSLVIAQCNGQRVVVAEDSLAPAIGTSVTCTADQTERREDKSDLSGTGISVSPQVGSSKGDTTAVTDVGVLCREQFGFLRLLGYVLLPARLRRSNEKRDAMRSCRDHNRAKNLLDYRTEISN
jgi:hypothetical protein